MRLLIIGFVLMLLLAGCTQPPAASPEGEEGNATDDQGDVVADDKGDTADNGDAMDDKGDTTDDGATDDKGDAMDAVAPSFWIVSPKEGSVGTTGTLLVEVGFENFEFGEPGSAPVANQGHFHVTVDSGQYSVCTSTTCEVPGVLPGSHTVTVSMQKNDHSSFDGVDPQIVTFIAR